MKKALLALVFAISVTASFAQTTVSDNEMSPNIAPQGTVMVSKFILKELRRDLVKARSQLQRGLTNEAEATIEESAYTLDLILNFQR